MVVVNVGCRYALNILDRNTADSTAPALLSEQLVKVIQADAMNPKQVGISFSAPVFDT